ncbi:MAG: radical SAM protein [Planctomycetota bacterium]|nr:MAG: radical SAM protein [Planctomycetota bacterium]
MRYEGKIYRPPSEADSLILQATIGCSYNRCSYCAMYQEKRFRPRKPAELREDMDLAARYHGPENVRRIFLADGDALILRTARLLEICDELRQRFPRLQRISAYASPQSLLAKSVAELEQLKAAGLSQHYLGAETGHPEVLELIDKGVTREQLIDGGRRVVDAGAKLSVILLLGIGGVELSREHAEASGSLITQIDPRFVSTLTITPVPGTRFHDDVQAGRVVLPDERGMLAEQRDMLAHMQPSRAIYRGNHVSNSLPVGGNLPRDRDKLLALLDRALSDERVPLRRRPSPGSL